MFVCVWTFFKLSKESRRISKKHSFYSDCVLICQTFSDLTAIPAQKREKPTTGAARLLRNLDRFSEKWQHISKLLLGDPLLRKSFRRK